MKSFRLVLLAMLLTGATLCAQEQRARPPVFDADRVNRVFFPDLSAALSGDRPRIGRRDVAVATKSSATSTAASSGNASDEGGWSKLITPQSIEDEVKRTKLQYDAIITTPGAFNGGGYRDARLKLSVLSMLFAIITDHNGDVRWKTDAAAARDLLARAARNAAAGSTQVYNECKLRKADLQDLISGGGLTSGKSDNGGNDWSMIADRSPLMQYAEELLDGLSDESRSADEARANVDTVRRRAELIAVLGEVLIQDGMDDSDDDDYKSLSRAMTAAAGQVTAAIQREDFESVREAVGAVGQSCAACHEQYR